MIDHEEVASDYNNVLARHVMSGVSVEDATSTAFGWIIGTVLREYGYSPEIIGKTAEALAKQILAKAERLRSNLM